mmetsp:Transcript_2249/g.5260  ORF Transcript_2249/g.5260 Transcript_2249/m.5260 type:complete len:332 (-) Transcript_2249:798-1793(-)
MKTTMTPRKNPHPMVKKPIHNPIPTTNPATTTTTTPSPGMAALAGIPTPPVLTEARIISVVRQILRALSFLHGKGYVHRDMKPENILMNGDVCKLADFGLALEESCQKTKTEYVSTRWYRAPEVLLRSPDYGKPIDLFALGCIVAELYTKTPLFPGDTEIDQLYRLTTTLGSPEKDWPQSTQLASKLGFSFPKQLQTLEKRIPNAPPVALAFIKDLLQWNPKDRPICEEALRHEYFSTPPLETDINNDNKRPIAAAAHPFPLAQAPIPPFYFENTYPLAKRRRGPEYVSPRSIHDVWDTLPPQPLPQPLLQPLPQPLSQTLSQLPPSFPFY